MSFQLEFVRCGKRKCKSCPHGPYWYEYRRVGNRTRKFYHGAKLPEQEQGDQVVQFLQGEPLHEEWEKIRSKETANRDLALEIMGLHANSAWLAKARMRSITRQYRGHNGPLPRPYLLAVLAYSYLKATRAR